MSATDPLDDLLEIAQPVRRRDLREPQTRRSRRAARRRVKALSVVEGRPLDGRRRGARRARPARRRSESAPSALRSPAASRRPVAARKPLIKRIATKFAPIVALGFAAALIVGTSVPASAFSSPTTSASASTSSSTTSGAPTRSATVKGQSLNSAAGAAALVSRDAFEAISVAELDAIQRASIGYGYTVNNSGPIRWPFPAPVPIGDRFGPRAAPCAGCSTFHNGTDFQPGDAAPVYAVAAGVVTESEFSGQLGQHVKISHVIDGKAFTSVYGHLATGSSPMMVGQTIAEGDVVGLVGSTGTSTGPHLDFEIDIDGTPTDSFVWLKANTVH